MNTEMTKAILDSRKTQTRRVAKDLFATALKYIGQNATGDTPAFEMATKRQKLLVTKILDDSEWGYKNGYKYSCQDIEKKYPSFYCEENEIELISKYQKGEVIWVREPARLNSFDEYYIYFQYVSDNTLGVLPMPEFYLKDGLPKWVKNVQGTPNGCLKEMARIFLKVIDVRVEMLHGISIEDIGKEGSPMDTKYAEDLGEDDFCYEWWIDTWDETAPKGYKWEDNPFVFVYEFERVHI